MNDEDVIFDMDENIGSYYDFNLLDLIEEYDNITVADSDDKSKVIKEL